MKKVYVRWLRAFRSCFSLKESIIFEMGRTDEAACEPLKKTNGSLRSGVYSRVGLLVKSESVFREFDMDCWSEYGSTRKGQLQHRLYATRCNNESNHGEAWFHASNAYVGIVVRGGLDETKKEDVNVILKASRRYSLPVYKLTAKGELVLDEVGKYEK